MHRPEQAKQAGVIRLFGVLSRLRNRFVSKGEYFAAGALYSSCFLEDTALDKSANMSWKRFRVIWELECVTNLCLNTAMHHLTSAGAFSQSYLTNFAGEKTQLVLLGGDKTRPSKEIWSTSWQLGINGWRLWRHSSTWLPLQHSGSFGN